MNPIALFVGGGREYQRVIAQLQVRYELVIVGEISAALQVLMGPVPPSHVFIAPSYREEFSRPALQRLAAANPLAEYFVIVGPWLEGETRSGHVWQGAERLYVDQVLPWVQATQDTATGRAFGGEGRWQPATLSSDERWELAVGRPWPVGRGTVAICSEDPSSREALSDVCVQGGYTSVTHGPADRVCSRKVQGVIYDAVADPRRWDVQVRMLAQRHQPRTLVALVNFPRSAEVESLLAAGATHVLGKPFRVDQLLVCLAGTLRTPTVTTRDRSARDVA